ncbi:hypothetical protein Mapa_000911 [Marchantia paleacea]|nr:hypothetical protein Mapa_000911 [Marchantia paleacea]
MQPRRAPPTPDIFVRPRQTILSFMAARTESSFRRWHSGKIKTAGRAWMCHHTSVARTKRRRIVYLNLSQCSTLIISTYFKWYMVHWIV